MGEYINKYFDNIIFYLQKSGGGSVYWGELIKRFLTNSNNHFIEPDCKTSNIFYINNQFNKILENKFIPLNILRYLPITIKLEENSIFHSSYYRISKQSTIKNVVTVHDFVYEKYYSGIPKYIHHNQKKIAISNATGIICISNSTKNDLINYFPELVRKKRIEVIYNGVSDIFNKLNISENKVLFPELLNVKCILFVGHRSIYKNFKFAVELLSCLPKDYKLGIVGKELTKEEKQMLNKKIPNKFIFFGNVSNEELNQIYNFSHCLLYPSSYEGFGIPVIEAFKSGCPVIAQNIDSIKEISKNNALLVNGLDKTKFLNQIISLNDINFREDKILCGIDISNDYSWNKCYSLVDQFYKSI